MHRSRGITNKWGVADIMQQIKISLIAAGMFFLVLGDASAAKMSGPIVDGHQLFDYCRHAESWLDQKPKMSPDEKNNAVLCLGYLLGFDAGHAATVEALPRSGGFGSANKKLYCVPAGTTMQSILSSVLSYLRNNKKKRYRLPPDLIAQALKSAYPC